MSDQAQAVAMTEAEAAEALLIQPESQDQPEAEKKAKAKEPEASNEDATGDEPETEEQAEEPEGDEPEGDEDSEEEDQDESEGETDEAEPDSEQPTFEVTVNGEKKEVTRDELVTGYMLNADYTRKTQEVAETRKELQAKRDAYQQAMSQRMGDVEFLASQLVNAIEQDEAGTDWEELKVLDPAEYAAKRESINQKRELLSRAYQQYQLVKSESESQGQAGMQERLEQEANLLLSKIPEWSNAETAEKEKGAIRDYLMSDFGYSVEEASGIADHRHVVLARKAMKYDQMQRSKQTTLKDKKAKPVPKLRKPGDENTGAARNRNQKALNRFRQTGTVDDLAAALLQ